MKKSILLLAAVAGLFFACHHQIVNPADPGGGTDTTGNGGGNTLICFEGDVLPTFVSSCAKSGCHNAVSKEEGYVLDSYQNIVKKGLKPGNANDSEIFEEIVSGDMPPNGEPKLSAAQIELIRDWINEGAKNTVDCSTCDTAVFTYSAAIEPLMSTNCTGCHSGSLPDGGIDLSSYTGVKTVALNGRLTGAVSHSAGFSAMPQGGNKLNECEISQIEKWIAAGTANN